MITSDPDTVKRVFTGDPEQLLAGVGNVVLKPLLGPRSVLLLDGPEHLRQRRLMLPSFHGERMRTYGETMRDAAERHVRRWPIGTSFPTQPSMQAITLEVILRAVFGVSDDREVERLATPLRRMLDATSSQARLVLLQLTKSEGAKPRSPWGRFRALMAPANDVVNEQIHARRADPDAAERDDVLSLLLAARDEEGQPLTDAELRDELMTLLLAGHETTATALSWTLERIVRHPDVLDRLVAEQQRGRRRVPRRGDQGDAAPAPGGARRGPLPDRAVLRQGVGAAGGRQRRPLDLPAPPPGRPLSGPARASVPSASSSSPPARTSGSPSAAASAAAWARASPSSR